VNYGHVEHQGTLMRYLIRVLLVGTLLMAVDSAAARQWVSRDGRFAVEAELLTVDGDEVVLRREEGAVIRVPLERLSLGDVKYVQEALQAAGLAPPAEGPTPALKQPPQMPRPQAVLPDEKTAPDGPPLAQPGGVQWQVAPDPAPQGFELEPGVVVEIPVEVRYSRPFVLYPATPSPFVLLGRDRSNGPRQLWDMRKGQMIGETDLDLDDDNKLALSCDGRYLAYHNHQTGEEVRIWSFASGAVAQTIKLPRYAYVKFLRFAGACRLVVGESKTDAFQVYDVETGRQCAAIDVEPQHDEASQALTPGGNFLAVYSSRAQQLVIYDTRNGVRAGRLTTDVESSTRPECLAFSDDGTELAGYFRDGSSALLQVWNLSDGKCVLTKQFAEDPSRKLGSVQYYGALLQWLADRGGWLLSGVAVVDRESAHVVWQDQSAIGNREVLPRRIVDTDRMLAFETQKNEQVLRLISIPKDEIAKSRAIVEAGGTAADAGLPPSTRIDMEGAKAVTLAPASWTYRAAPSSLPPKAAVRDRWRLAGGNPDVRRAFFSKPEVARMAIGESVADGRAAWKTASLLPQACQLYDLQSGEQLNRFEIPFPTEFLDLSPDGKLGLFCIDDKKDRLDLWNLEDGQHVLAFRPYEGETSYNCRIRWAGFADENHLVTLSDHCKLVGWKLPECRAVYASDPSLGWVAGMARDRRTLVVMCGRTPHLIDALSGELLGTLPEIESDGMLLLPRAGFSGDENRLAVLSAREEGCLVAAWDMTDRSRLLNLELPFRAYGMVWCGPDHILVNRSTGADEPDVLIDVQQGLVVWNYAATRGTSLASTPDGRCWFECCPGITGPSELAAFELPEAEVMSILSRVVSPEPLIGPNAAVTVQTQIEDPPQVIPPGWAGLEKLDEGLYQHFAKQLQERHVAVVARGNVRLVVGIEQEKKEQTMSVGGLFGPSRRFLLSATLLMPYVAVVDSSGNRIWSRLPKKNDMKPANLEDCPEGVDKEAYMKLHQWEQAVAWLRTVKIPYPLFHPSVHRGFGESVLTPGKTEIRRSPSPAQMKPESKTAKLVNAGVGHPG